MPRERSTPTSWLYHHRKCRLCLVLSRCDCKALRIFPVKCSRESPDPGDRRANRCAPRLECVQCHKGTRSSFDSTIRIPSSLRCFSSQSVSTSASGCAYSVGCVAMGRKTSGCFHLVATRFAATVHVL